MPLRHPMAIFIDAGTIMPGFSPIQGEPMPRLAGAVSRHFAKNVVLTRSVCPLSNNWRRDAPGEHRPNPRFHDRHHRPATRAQDRRASFEPCGGLGGDELEQHMQQRDYALAVRMQKAEVARTPKSLGQHMLHHQP